MRGILAPVVVLASLAPVEAAAQYKSAQLGFEGGYGFYAGDLGLDLHGFMVGLRGCFKAEDHWWFSARALLSLRGEQSSERTVVILNLTPVSARYYFLTDAFRPFLGITNAFQFLFNKEVDGFALFWGPGVEAGIEIKIVRDIFIGFQGDFLYMFAFEAPDDPMFTVTAQLNFFL
jgi:hypothetical protein